MMNDNHIEQEAYRALHCGKIENIIADHMWLGNSHSRTSGKAKRT